MTATNIVIRKRAKNFLPEEEVLLVDLVEDHSHCIESKKSNAVVWKEKEEAWCKIEQKFAAASGTHRSWKALRDKYEGIKRKSKAEIADQKLETYRTGGGVASSNVSAVSAKVASMLGDSATGLENKFDCDTHIANYLEFESSIESVDQQENTSERFGESSIATKKQNDWSTWRPSTLKEPKSKELVNGGKRKRNAEEERMELIILQQKFYRDENTRAQEKHELELQSLKYKNELLQLELEEKITKSA